MKSEEGKESDNREKIFETDRDQEDPEVSEHSGPGIEKALRTMLDGSG